jgi:hypothetical protein
VTFENRDHKTPAVVWPVNVQFVLRDEQGMAIDPPEGLNTELTGMMAARPPTGDLVTLQVGGEFQWWRVTGPGEWFPVFPRDGQMTPSSVVVLGLVRVGDEQIRRDRVRAAGGLVFEGVLEYEGLQDSGRAMVTRLTDAATYDDEDGEYVRLQSYQRDAKVASDHPAVWRLVDRRVRITVEPLDGAAEG